MNNYVIQKETNSEPRLLTYLSRKPLAGPELIAYSTAFECERGENAGRHCQRVKLEAKVGDPLPKAGRLGGSFEETSLTKIRRSLRARRVEAGCRLRQPSDEIVDSFLVRLEAGCA